MDEKLLDVIEVVENDLDQLKYICRFSRNDNFARKRLQQLGERLIEASMTE